MRRLELFILTIICICAPVYGENNSSYSFAITSNFTLKGKATGGTLFLCNIMGRNAPFVCIDTLPDESPESVLYRMAKEIAYTDAIFDHSHYINFDRELSLKNMVQGDTLKIPGLPGDYVLAGSENGFDIPRAPLFLSCSYNKYKDEIILNWENPTSYYDFMFVRLFWSKFKYMITRKLEGNPISIKINRKDIPVDINDTDVRVFGVRNNLPSSLSVVRLTSKGTMQTEEFGLPFTNNIAPNWKAWSDNEINVMEFEMGVKFDKIKTYNPASALSTKPFYQVIKGSKTGNIHGIYRKFLGLTPGHTYRIIAGLTDFDMNSIDDDWSYSICAAYNNGREDLSTSQLAGLSNLPNGKKGTNAGEIASFNKVKRTKREFSIICSDPNSNITLPSDASIITVWVRFDCKNPNGKVGFSGVKLEDITDNPNIKPIRQIQQEESLEEIQLFNRE